MEAFHRFLVVCAFVAPYGHDDRDGSKPEEDVVFHGFFAPYGHGLYRACFFFMDPIEQSTSDGDRPAHVRSVCGPTIVNLTGGSQVEPLLEGDVQEGYITDSKPLDAEVRGVVKRMEVVPVCSIAIVALARVRG